MHVPKVTQEAVDALTRYAKTIYLTQTVEKKDGKLNRFLNLEDAFAAWENDPGPREWRTHFHVPVFLDDLGAVPHHALRDRGRAQVPQGEPAVAPARDRDLHLGRAARHLKTGDIVDYVCREIEWVSGQLVINRIERRTS